jgi:polyphosphate kinase
MKEKRFVKRDISWLAFNHRVLQEAEDHSVPLYERIKFLAIFSSNLDEFFRVRVSSLYSFRSLDKVTRKSLPLNPKKTLRRIRIIAQEQQEEFGRIFRQEIIPALEEKKIYLVTSSDFTEEEEVFVKDFFDKKVREHVSFQSIKVVGEPPFLKNRGLYFATQLSSTSSSYGLVNIPSDLLGRFVVLPSDGTFFRITFIDEVIRFCLGSVDPDIKKAYALKLSRDADLNIEDEFSGDLLEKIKAGLKGR